MSWATGAYQNETSELATKISGFARLVNSSIMGAGTGLRDTASVPVMAIPYIKSMGDFKAFYTGVMNYRKEAANALRTGAYQPNIDKIQFGESVNKMDSLLSIAATNMRKWQGREAIENFNRKVVFAGGKELMRANVVGARAGNKNALKTIERFSTLVDGDVTKMKGEELEAALNQMAKNFTDVNQGTYGGSGLPLGIVDSQFAPFTALMKWSVEKSNVIYKDVVKPAYTGESFVPLITYTLGTIPTGAPIQELNKVLTGRKASDPNIKEALDKGTVESIVSEIATIAQLASFGGIIGDLAKAATDVGLHGKTPRNIVSFPAATTAVDIAEKTTDLAEAIRQGEDVWEVFSKYSLDLISHNIQNARMIANHTVKEGDVERSDKFRDMRVYNELEGKRASDIPTSNQYLGISERAFKREPDPVAAMRQLPALLKKAIADSKGDPFELKRKLQSLKQNNYQTMPNMENAPLSFMRYLQFLKNTQGEQAANERLMDYIRQNAVNKAKSSAL